MSAPISTPTPAPAVNVVSAATAYQATALRVAELLGGSWRPTRAIPAGPSPVVAHRIRLNGQLPSGWWVATGYSGSGEPHTIDLVRTTGLTPDKEAEVIAQAITDRLGWVARR
ncbi:hypothetical protein F7Q99_36235 [Streptomyces kaniharaensis]|uniref:Uncharacterized protein n=1 Tax=Streptomyces kaniharaensis TaxID=212423 RepID=A0A6N7L0X1_9ACTN|nr:hypothetical protein [Streptomyces kaniharaensis]MQS17492.1 hypothetical protein [Streptomyces kaniharaensis]